MPASQKNPVAELSAELSKNGFSFVPAASMRALLQDDLALSDWAHFADSWNRLAVDTYLAQLGRHRRRRHALFRIDGGTIQRSAHGPHYQSEHYNTLQGGIERWFEPIENQVANGSSLRSILYFCRNLFGSLTPDVGHWLIEVHQFRIEARSGEPGEPTPEGLHRDGVDYVLVLLVDRVNIASGTTTIHALDHSLLGSFTLIQACDAALVDDARVFHGVTAVQAVDPALPAHRDVLVVTFKRF